MKHLAIKNLIYLLMLGICLAVGAASAGTKILKWLDKQGITHYGDKPPSFDESKSNVEMNNHGQVVKRNDYVVKKTNEQDLQQQEQDRKDKILLASYTNANEIDLARDRSLEMNKAALTSLVSQKESITARIIRNKTTADDFQKRNKPLPANLDKEFKGAIAQSGLLDKQMASRKLEMETTRKIYADDKARYLILKEPANNAEPENPVAQSTTTEKMAVEKVTVEKLKSNKK